MSDRLDLDDRDGLRTPMQWDATAHGGFTTGALATIPANEHAMWGFSSLNVAGVVDAADSLFDRLAAMLRIRREHPAFGHGTVTFLDTTSPSILALQRRHAGDTVLFVGNLSSEPQATGIDVPSAAVRLSPAPDRERLAAPATGLLELAPYEWRWWSVPRD
jgi:maltose alpha-D-glucosyltransferase/alpha-amylase